MFGLIPIPKDSVVFESGVKVDTNDLTIFKTSTYDSQRVAKKAQVDNAGVHTPTFVIVPAVTI